jgi:hypothetical protein
MGTMQRQINEALTLFQQYADNINTPAEEKLMPTLACDIIDSSLPVKKPTEYTQEQLDERNRITSEPTVTVPLAGYNEEILAKGRPTVAEQPGVNQKQLYKAARGYIPSDAAANPIPEYKPQNDPLKKGDPNALPESLHNRLMVPLGTFLNRFVRGENANSVMLRMDKFHAAEFLTFIQKINEWVGGHSLYAKNGVDNIPILARSYIDIGKLLYILTSSADSLSRTINASRPQLPPNINEGIVAYIVGRAWLQGGSINYPDNAPAEFRIAAEATENILLKSETVGSTFTEMVKDGHGWLSRVVRNFFGPRYAREFNLMLNKPWEHIHEIHLVMESVSWLYVLSDFYIKQIYSEKKVTDRANLEERIERVYLSLIEKFPNIRRDIFVPEAHGVSPTADIDHPHVAQFYQQASEFVKIIQRINTELKYHDDARLVHNLTKWITLILLGQLAPRISGVRQTALDTAWRQLQNLAHVNDALRQEIFKYIVAQEGHGELSLMSQMLQYLFKPSDSMKYLEMMSQNMIEMDTMGDLAEAAVNLADLYTYTMEYRGINEGTRGPIEELGDAPEPEKLDSAEVAEVVTPDLGSSVVGDDAVDKALDVLTTFLGSGRGDDFRKAIEARIQERKGKVQSAVQPAEPVVEKEEAPKPISTFTNPLYDITRPDILKELSLTFSGEICNQYVGKVRPSSVRSGSTFRVHNEDLITHYRQINNEWPDGFYKDQDTGDYQFLLKLSADIYVIILFRTQAELAQVVRLNVQNNAVPFDEVYITLMTQLAMISGR